MEPWTVLSEQDYPLRTAIAPVTLMANHTNSQSMANMVSLNLIILKEHVVKHDLFGFCYLEAIVDLALDEIVRETRNGNHNGLPMELINIYCSIEGVQKSSKKKMYPIREFIRGYVQLWCKLSNYIASTFSYQIAERIMLEAYNHKAGHKYQHKLKIVKRNPSA